MLQGAMKQGAFDLLEKPFRADELIGAIRNALGSAKGLQTNEANTNEVALARLATLSLRETEVLELVAEGLSNKAVAARLGISDQTVKFHLTSLSGKLGAINRTDAVRRAVRRGLITL